MLDDNSRPWTRGYLLPRLTAATPELVIHQHLLMVWIDRATHNGLNTKTLETLELVVSVTDDAIDNMMRVDR